MNSDLKIIQDARQIIKNSVKEFSAAYVENAGENSSAKIRAAIDGQLRIAKQLSSLENFYSTGISKSEYADSDAVEKYKLSMGKEI